MIRFVNKLPLKTTGKVMANVSQRAMSCQPPQKMEDYFKDKKFIVTGSSAGKSCANRM